MNNELENGTSNSGKHSSMTQKLENLKKDMINPMLNRNTVEFYLAILKLLPEAKKDF